jgi:hypothetical protein
VLFVLVVGASVLATGWLISDAFKTKASIRLLESSSAAAIELAGGWATRASAVVLYLGLGVCAAMVVMLLTVPDGFRGLWLPPLLAAIGFGMRSLTRRQYRRYAQVFFGVDMSESRGVDPAMAALFPDRLLAIVSDSSLPSADREAAAQELDRRGMLD